jgi:hypothetical protein
MGPPLSLRTRLWIGGLAAGGVAIAHTVAFLVAAPDPLRREELLDATGHGSWPLIVAIAMGALVAALTGFVAGRFRGHHSTAPAALFRGTAVRLVPLQVVAFVILEALERLVMGHVPTDLLGEPVLVIGLIAQPLVALAGSLLLTLFARLVDRLVVLLHQVPRAPRALVPQGVLAAPFPRTRIATDPANPRGPPWRT